MIVFDFHPALAVESYKFLDGIDHAENLVSPTILV